MPCLIGLVLATLPAFHVVAAQEPKLLQEFTLEEHFGVTHADQVVVFALQKKADPDHCHLLDDAGKEVPFQRVDGGPMGSIAFCMDLPANATRTFKLISGPGTKAPDGVKVDESNPDYIEIINGLAGVRVPRVYSPLTTTPKAPIQGVRFRDGSWSRGGTPLQFKKNDNEGGITSVDAMTVTVKEIGPVRAVVEVRYDITSPELTYGALKIRPAGPAHYTTTFTLERGQPSVLIETDTDLYSTFSFSLYEGVRPTQLRYCGHNASEPKYGRIEDGSQYPVAHARPGMDAIVDLDYAQPVEVYALGVPLSLGWENMYSPHNPTPYSRCGVVPEKALSIAWNVDLPSVYEPGEPWDWKTQRQDAFASFRESAWAEMSSGAREGDLKWTRQVASIHPDRSCPLLLIRDTLEGGRATEPMIFNMHLVAEGPVETCAGAVMPGEAFWDVNDRNKQQPPAGGKAHALPAGLNKFAFKGQQFGKPGETPAIDFDLYSLAADAREFCLGSWGHNVSQGAHVSNVFRPVNGRPYELRQHLLHIKGAGGFTTLIVPRLKGAETPVVTQDGGKWSAGDSKIVAPDDSFLRLADNRSEQVLV